MFAVKFTDFGPEKTSPTGYFSATYYPILVLVVSNKNA